LPEADSYTAETLVAAFVSPPYAEFARLILKVSLNLGANVSLMLFALTHDQRTVSEALAVERETLIDWAGLAPDSFEFPTNGSGTPDSQASARAVVQMLSAMSETDVAAVYRASLPILGVDGSLAEVGGDLPGKGHVLAKTGTTLDASGIKVQNLAGYIDARSGRQLAFALLLNDAGPIEGIEDVLEVLEDVAAITSAIYEMG
jgi:D-alanyl-D-alanine carboxypeptidase/D-alanyl-D-alanine-endopeptidase (penicillin-binding protein 4)